jgi:hypothetical protein
LLVLAALGACRSSTSAKDPSVWPPNTTVTTGSFSFAATFNDPRAATDPLEFTLHLTNTGSADGMVVYGSCSVGVEAYTSAARSGTPAWTSAAFDAAHCADGTLRSWTVPAQEEMWLRTSVIETSDMYATSTPLHLFFSLVYRNETKQFRVPAGESDVAR